MKSVSRSLITLSMNLLLILAAALTVSAVIQFFGALESKPGLAWIAEIGKFFTPDLGLPITTTPFGGIFDIDLVVMIALIIFCEWMLSVARNKL